MNLNKKAALAGAAIVNYDAKNYTSSKIDNLLSHLRKVRKTGNGRWIACCPSHQDKNPSLSIRDDDDTILLNCHASCNVFEILSAVGMNITDLFPERNEYSKPMRNPFPAADVLRCLQTEAMIILVIASDIKQGGTLTDERMNRLAVAVGRIFGAYND